eukprot:SAG22_NODE_277_length_13166_cov_134.125277_8_plen_312_part_00
MAGAGPQREPGGDGAHGLPDGGPKSLKTTPQEPRRRSSRRLGGDDDELPSAGGGGTSGAGLADRSGQAPLQPAGAAQPMATAPVAAAGAGAGAAGAAAAADASPPGSSPESPPEVDSDDDKENKVNGRSSSGSDASAASATSNGGGSSGGGKAVKAASSSGAETAAAAASVAAAAAATVSSNEMTAAGGAVEVAVSALPTGRIRKAPIKFSESKFRGRWVDALAGSGTAVLASAALLAQLVDRADSRSNPLSHTDSLAQHMIIRVLSGSTPERNSDESKPSSSNPKPGYSCRLSLAGSCDSKRKDSRFDLR